MCIRHEAREKARRSFDFSPVSKPHTHITYMLRQCTSIVYIWLFPYHIPYQPETPISSRELTLGMILVSQVDTGCDTFSRDDIGVSG